MCAIDSIEIIGLTPEAVGKQDASQTTRLRTSHVSPFGLHADVAALPPMRAEPMMWNEPYVQRPVSHPHASASCMNLARPPFPGVYDTSRECDENTRCAPAASWMRTSCSTPARMSRMSSSLVTGYCDTELPSGSTATRPWPRSRTS